MDRRAIRQRYRAQPDLFTRPMQVDGTAALRERDEGIEKAQDPTIADMLRAVLPGFVGLKFTGEDLRIAAGAASCHPNAWGAAVNALVRRGCLKKTGEYRTPRSTASHARAIQVYELGPRGWA